MTMDWDAASYAQVAQAQYEWGHEVLARRQWRGDETVLDAGCGPGRHAEDLLARLPQGRVVAVDRDPAMVAETHRRLAPHGDRAMVVAADLAELPALPPADVVFSNAVLHWVADHDAAFRGFHRALKPGGELLAQCGGKGNISVLRRVCSDIISGPTYAQAFRGWEPTWHYEDDRDTARRLREAGFDEVETGLQRRPVRFTRKEDLVAFAAAAPLRPYLARLPKERHEGFLRDFGAAYPSLELDYVRLDMRAGKPG